MAMFSFYGDASGKEETDLLAVAGFVATAEEWLNFSRQWDLTLKDFGVAHLHMKEFAHSIGQFAGWRDDEPKRQQFLSSVRNVIQSHARYLVGAVLIKADYVKVDSEYQLHEYLAPFPLCGFLCADIVEKWRGAHNLLDASMEYIFERGDQKRGQLINAMDEKYGVVPIFRDKYKHSPLQAADYAAYEMYSAYKQYRVDTHKLFERIRVSFGLLANIPHYFGDFTERGLRVFCRLREIPPRR